MLLIIITIYNYCIIAAVIQRLEQFGGLIIITIYNYCIIAAVIQRLEQFGGLYTV